MNKIYYEGELLFNSRKDYFHFNYDVTKKSDFSSDERDYLLPIVRDYFSRSKTIEELIDDEISQKALNRIIKLPHSDSQVMNKIIFEIIENEDGFKFGKEIYTNKIFPLIEEKDVKKTFYLIEADIDNSHYVSRSRTLYDFKYTIKTIFDITNSIIANANVILYLPKCKIANENEINKYLNSFKHKGIFGKEKPNTKLSNSIIKLSNENVFNYEIIEKKEEKIEREKQNEITSTMENIELLLIKLDKINHDLRLEKQKKYENLINSNDENLTTSPFNLNTLKMLQAEIECSIEFNSKDGKDILNTLDNMLIEYENNKTPRTISDIDNLCKLFLQMKDNFSYPVQRKTISKLALLYIYELYENKDSINIEDLSNSYINDILKSIVICLNTLIDNNIIENNIIIKLDDISLDYIVDCIKNIKFTDNKVKRLI